MKRDWHPAPRRRRSLAMALAALVVVGGCSAGHHGHAARGNRSAGLLYSPNGEPLNGGPLDHPPCPEAMSAWFARVDANHDGVIDASEYLADARRQFAAMDLDGDGEITPAELAQYRAPYENDTMAAQPGAAETSAQPNGGEGRRRQRHNGAAGSRSSGAGAGTDQADPVMVADVQLRFRVSLAEFLAFETRKFAALDKDGDGRLTKDELLQTCRDAHRG